MMTTELLATEMDTFNRLLPELLLQVGRYALIKGDKLVDTFDSYHDAIKRGYALFSLEPFLVKKIAPAMPVAYFSRDLTTCPA